jgi:transposase-like protein
MSKYNTEFKMEAVKRVETSNLPIARVAVELGVVYFTRIAELSTALMSINDC